MGRRIKPYDIEDVQIADAATDGRAIVKHDGQAIFLERGVPGDRVDIHVYRKHKKVPMGRITRMIEPSPDRVEPRCSHFGTCGGCKWQMMSYEAQLKYKQKHVQNAMQRIAKVEVGESLPILGVETPYYYRNKLEFSFSDRPWLTKEQIASGKHIEFPSLGFHVPGVFDKVLNVDHCYLQKPIVNDIRNAVREYAVGEDIPFYNVRAHTGFLRELMFRTAEHSGELMLLLIVAEDKPETVGEIFEHLSEKFSEISSFAWVHNPKLNNSYADLDYQIWKGNAYISERLGGYDFQISPTSFFQTNPKQAEVLYGVVKDWLKEVLPEGQEKHKIVYDLYSGTGSIGIFVSELAEKIVGIEYVESSIEDAWKNVKLNGLEHFRFFAGDMKKLLTDDMTSREGQPDVVIVDPPRAGMDPKVITQLLNLAPRHIIYVSCKPATQARDIDLMREQYKVTKIRPVDMFPHTAHVENVALLERI